MLLKYGVNVIGLSPHITSKFGVLDDIFLKHAFRECIITSGNDGQHMVGSLHYKGEAIDVRTKDLTHSTVQEVFGAIKAKLGDIYDVILEPTHIHIEYDPK